MHLLPSMHWYVACDNHSKNLSCTIILIEKVDHLILTFSEMMFPFFYMCICSVWNNFTFTVLHKILTVYFYFLPLVVQGISLKPPKSN